AIHFVGEREEITPLFRAAEVVWVPDRIDGGVITALEGMAAERPIIASRLPSLAQVVQEGESGFLVPPGDKPALARQTRILLDERNRAEQMGQRGRLRVAEHFAVAAMVERFGALYENVG